MKEEDVVISVLTVQGLVQGVGFRPFIYRIASEMNICGEVDNRNNGVCIRAVLTSAQRELFIERIYRERPKVASIHRITISEKIEAKNPYTDFRITPSRSESDEVTQVAPDIAVCSECLRDRKMQAHRLQYPFSTVRIVDLAFPLSVICLMIGARQPCRLSRCVRPAGKNTQRSATGVFMPSLLPVTIAVRLITPYIIR